MSKGEWKRKVDEAIEQLQAERESPLPTSRFDSLVNIRYLQSQLSPLNSKISAVDSELSALNSKLSALDRELSSRKLLWSSIRLINQLFLIPSNNYWASMSFLPISSPVFSLWVAENDYTISSALDKKVVLEMVRIDVGNWYLPYRFAFGSLMAENNKLIVMQAPKPRLYNIITGSFSITNQTSGPCGYKTSATPPQEVGIPFNMDTSVFAIYYNWGTKEYLHSGCAFYENAKADTMSGTLYTIRHDPSSGSYKARIVVKASWVYSTMHYTLLHYRLPAPTIKVEKSITYQKNSTVFITELGETLPEFVDIMIGNSSARIYAPECISAYNNINSISTLNSEPPEYWGFWWKKILKYNTQSGKWEVWVYFPNCGALTSPFGSYAVDTVIVRAWY